MNEHFKDGPDSYKDLKPKAEEEGEFFSPLSAREWVFVIGFCVFILWLLY